MRRPVDQFGMSANSRSKPSGIGKIAFPVEAAIFCEWDMRDQCGDRSHTMDLKPLLLDLGGWKLRRVPALRESVQTNCLVVVRNPCIFA